jgi:hypothetical protein
MYTDKKFIFLFFCMSLSLVFSCAKIAPPTPLRAEYAELERGEIVSNISVSGTVVKKQDSVGVQKFDETSWINLQFKGEIDTTSTGVKVIDAAGREVPFTREWDVSPEVTGLVLKPAERLNYNTVYLLKISGIGIYKLNGQYADINRNGVPGELIDDDFIFPFVTFKNDNSKGDWRGIGLDKIPPFVTPSFKFLIEGQPTDYGWIDADIALAIYDYTWDTADTSIIVASVDTATLDKDKFKIVEESTQKEVLIKEINYIGNPDTADFGSVLIDPVDNLEPESYYILKVLGGISDFFGNKLGEDGSVVFEKRFKTFSCNHDSSECARDTTAPVVLKWRVIGPAFEISFSELINPESVTDGSIYVPELEGKLSLRNEGGQTYLRFTTLMRKSVFGYTAFVTEKVEDMAGNKAKEASFYFERKTD